MKLLITGGSGTLGKNITKLAVSKNYQVNILTRNKKLTSIKNDINYLAFPIRTKHKIYTPNKNPIYILKEKKHNYVLKAIEKELKFNKNQNTIIKNFICYHPSLKKL